MAAAARVYYSALKPARGASPPSFNVPVANTGGVPSACVVLGFLTPASGQAAASEDGGGIHDGGMEAGDRKDGGREDRGGMDGDVENDSDDEPIRQLFDFARTQVLAPGESTVLQLSVPPHVLARVDEAGVQRLVPGW